MNLLSKALMTAASASEALASTNGREKRVDDFDLVTCDTPSHCFNFDIFCNSNVFCN